MDNNIGILDPEEADEAISLSDFPITSTTDQSIRRTSSEPTEFFEFFNDLNSQMSHAEDIIFCGKLVPFKDHSLSDQTHNTTTTTTTITNKDNIKMKSFHRRRSESLSELKFSQSSNNSPKTQFMRNSKSLDYQKLRRTLSINSETSSEIHRNSSVKSWSQKGSKPRCYFFMFGLVKFPPEMELKDMKSRQVRRTPASLFPAFDSEKRFEVNRSHRKSSWGLFKIFSCKGHDSVAVTASFGSMPPV